MNTFIQNLLLINAGIAVVIAAFILLRYFLKNKVHTKTLCILWLIIFLRMLIPVPIESNIGVVDKNIVLDSYTAAQNYVKTRTNSASENADTNEGAIINAAENETTNDAAAINTVDNALQTGKSDLVNNPIKKFDIALIIYIFGAAIVFGYILISNILFNKRIKQNSVEIRLDSSDKQVFTEQKMKQQKVYVVKDLHSPCLMGVIRPRILLNGKSTENEKIRRYSLYHETTHYKHKDNIIFLLGLIACIINWFNPFMWIALNLSKKDREVLCDEKVVRLIGENEVIDYGKSLLFLAQNANSRLLIAPTTMTGGKKEMKQRIKNLTNSKKRWIIISVLIAAVVIALIFVIGTKKLPEISEESVSSLQVIYNQEAHPEYVELFDKLRDTKDTSIFAIYRTDVDKDGTDEIYASSINKSDDFIKGIIECYDIKTKTYSKIIDTNGWKYQLITYGDKIYIFATNQAETASDDCFHIYQPFMEDGELTYEEVDSELEERVLDYYANNMYFSLNIINISIYDISSDEVLISGYPQNNNKVREKLCLLFGIGGSYDEEEINHQYKAVIHIIDDGTQKTLTYLFGDSEYITTVIGDEKSNGRNDGLRNYLNYLAAEGDAR